MTPPPHLDDQAAGKWAELFPILADRARDLDGDTPSTTARDGLAAYCLAYSHHLTAEGQVAALGLVVKSPAGFPVDNPYLAISRKAQAEMRRWAALLRLTG